MLASLRNGHAIFARLARRPIVAQQVRATTTAKTTVKRTRKATAERAPTRKKTASSQEESLAETTTAEGKQRVRRTRKTPAATTEDPTETAAGLSAKGAAKITAAEKNDSATTPEDPTENDTESVAADGGETAKKARGSTRRKTAKTTAKTTGRMKKAKAEAKEAAKKAAEVQKAEEEIKAVARKTARTRKTVAKILETDEEKEAREAKEAEEAKLAAEKERKEKKKEHPMLSVKGPVARKLGETNLWARARCRKSVPGPRVVDPRRVNIVSSQLCDAVIKNLGPSLERHRGCDLVDLNPGVGLWSQTLHDVLEPREHVLMDLDAELYAPFLAKLLDKDQVELVPRSGIVWKDLLEMMDTHLPGQTERDKREVPARNDTLLVTANLSMFPKKTFHGFESVSTMVLYQLLSSIRTSSLFQKYGLVRMLVWINDEDKKRILPRSLARRKRSAFEAEISCDWVHEVAGADDPENRCSLRDWWINTESEYRAMERMAAQGLELPGNRMTRAYKECKARPELMGQMLAGVHPPTLDRPFKGELEQLRRAEQRGGSNEATSKRLKILQSREKLVEGEALQYREYLQQFTDISRLAASSPAEFEAADAQWNERIGNLKKNLRVEFKSIKDNYTLFRQDPPAMLWDRRALEPINVLATDFLPNAPTALLDIQPKAMRPVFRQYGPASSRSGDMSDIMLRFWYQHTLFPMAKAMDGLWGGFGDLASQCPSLTDPARGGSPLTGHGALVSRAMNEEQWAEVVQAWMDWPFRPTYVQMLGRMVEEVDGEGDDDDGKSGAMGVML